MQLIRNHPFAISDLFQRLLSQQSAPVHSSYEGLVTRVGVRFHHWLGGAQLEAEAFIDTGCDESVFSLRWLEQQAEIHKEQGLPQLSSEFNLVEQTEICFRDHPRFFSLCTPPGTAHIRRQPNAQRLARIPVPSWRNQRWANKDRTLQGFEDLLVGRDFLTAHGMLLVIDNEHRQFSLLWPGDPSNQNTRDEIMAHF